jgi:hypothetical protein
LDAGPGATWPVEAAGRVCRGLLGVLVRRWWVVLLATVTWAGIALFLGFKYRWSDAYWGEWGLALVIFFSRLTVRAPLVRRYGVRCAW